MATDFDAMLDRYPRYTGRWMGKDSFVNRPLPEDAPIDPDSAQYVNTLANRAMPTRQMDPLYGIQANGFCLFAWWYSTYTVWIVDRDDPSSYSLYDVQFDRTDGELSGMTPLTNAFKQVPIPHAARPSPHYSSPPGSPGNDNAIQIYDPLTDHYWEMWHPCHVEVDGPHTQVQKFTKNVPIDRLNKPGWHCGYGGAVKKMSHSPGHFDNTAWDGAGAGWGASGGKIIFGSGMVTRTEAVNAKRDSTPIPHVIACGIASPHFSKFRWPAQTTDGNGSNPWAPQYGMIYRFPADYDVDSVTADPFVTEVMRAMRDYGLIVREFAGGVTIMCENGNTREDEAPLKVTNNGATPVPGYGINQFADDIWLGDDNTTGAHHDGIFIDQPTKIGDVIPWPDLQVLDKTYRPSSPSKSRLIIGAP